MSVRGHSPNNPKLRSQTSKQSSHAPPLQIQSSAEFINDFVPPDYLIDWLIQRRFIYSMTGPTGEGKTSVALLLALLVDRGWPLDGREIERARFSSLQAKILTTCAYAGASYRGHEGRPR